MADHTMNLFLPPIDEAVLEAKARAAGFDWNYEFASYEEFRETCPKCHAERGDLCAKRGTPVETHLARVRVSSLRYAQAWVPSPGDHVGIGYDRIDSKRLPGIFIGFTPEGEAKIDDLGAGWTFHRFDALMMWPRI